jgi:cell division protein FtsI (penicillin-binding protein 3)
LVSTIANDGVYVPPRIIAGTTPPRSTPQLIAFHPAIGRRVISTLTAAQMKRMMEGVVLRGTGKKAILDGYSSAGKTGTAQKIDATGHYSHRQHIASFGGFAPVNNPAVTVLVVLDSPDGPYPRDGGGIAAAPVFSRVAQQVLTYLHVRHDVELQDPKRLLLRARAKDADLAEGSPEYIADQAEPPIDAPAPTSTPVAPTETRTTTVAKARPPATPVASTVAPAPSPTTATSAPTRGTVVLDVGGGVIVPDFHGKPLRSALEEAESAGIELEVSGSGVGQTQSPLAGARIPPGGHVSVVFGR